MLPGEQAEAEEEVMNPCLLHTQKAQARVLVCNDLAGDMDSARGLEKLKASVDMLSRRGMSKVEAIESAAEQVRMVGTCAAVDHHVVGYTSASEWEMLRETGAALVALDCVVDATRFLLAEETVSSGHYPVRVLRHLLVS